MARAAEPPGTGPADAAPPDAGPREDAGAAPGIPGPPPGVVARLRAAGCVFAEDEARILAETARTPAELAALTERRAAGLPLEQVVGWAEFGGLRVAVEPGVFVPRRRSEFLVQHAVAHVRAGGMTAPPATPDQTAPDQATAGYAASGRTVVLDLCCGSGALGVAVARALGGAELHAADADPAAVRCAARNVAAVGGRVYPGDLYTPLPATLRGRVSLLIANAPYVPTAEVRLLPAEAREHEPLLALDGGGDGLAVLRRVAAGAPGWLAPGGCLLVETSERQAAAMASAVTAAGLTARVVSSAGWAATVVLGVRPV